MVGDVRRRGQRAERARCRMTEVTTRTLTAADEPDYSRFVAGHSDGLFYASLAYRDFLVELLGCDAPYRIARDADGAVAGILPLMALEGPFGRVINSLPYYGSHGGVLARTPEVAKALTAAFDALAADRSTAVSVWIDHPFSPPKTGPSYETHSDQRIGQATKLPSGDDAAETLLTGIEASARRNIKKARREGVTVRVDNDALAFLESVHRENMASIGGRAKSPQFFAGIPRHFQSGVDYRVWLAERDGEPLAALLLFYFNRTVEYFVPATTHTGRTYQPMALILETAMLDAAARGYLRWNWGGTWMDQSGVYRFKRKWGGDDYPYRYHICVSNTDILGATPQALLDAYPGFYTVPFSALEGQRAHG